MDIAQDGSFAYIDLGEVKTSLDYATAGPQLSSRLGVLKWFVCKACTEQRKRRCGWAAACSCSSKGPKSLSITLRESKLPKYL